MNFMKGGGYSARIEYDVEKDFFRGEILGLSGGADCYGPNPDELRHEFRGIESRKHCSEKFNPRISPELHQRLVSAAGAQGKSINTLAQEAIQIGVNASRGCLDENNAVACPHEKGPGLPRA